VIVAPTSPARAPPPARPQASGRGHRMRETLLVVSLPRRARVVFVLPAAPMVLLVLWGASRPRRLPARADRPPCPLQPVGLGLIDKGASGRGGPAASSGCRATHGGPMWRNAPRRSVGESPVAEGGLRSLASGRRRRAPRGASRPWLGDQVAAQDGPPPARCLSLLVGQGGQPSARRAAGPVAWRPPRIARGDRPPQGPAELPRPRTPRASMAMPCGRWFT